MIPPPRKPGAWFVYDMFGEQVFDSTTDYMTAWWQVLDAICADYDISGWSIRWRPNPADPTQKSAYEAGRFDSKWRFK